MFYHNCTLPATAVIVVTDSCNLSASALLACTVTVRMGHMLQDTVRMSSHWPLHCPFYSFTVQRDMYSVIRRSILFFSSPFTNRLNHFITRQTSDKAIYPASAELSDTHVLYQLLV